MATKFGRERPWDVERGVYRRLHHGSAHGIPVRYFIFFGLVAMAILFGLASRNLTRSDATVDVPAVVVSKLEAPDASRPEYIVRIRLRDDAKASEYSVVVDEEVWAAVETGMSVQAAVRRGFRPIPVGIRLEPDESPAIEEARPLFEAIPVDDEPGLPSDSPVP